MIKMNPRNIALAAAFSALGLWLDQWSKGWAAARLPGNPLEVIQGALSFVYVENRNAAFGLGNQLPDSAKVWVLIGLTSALTLALVVAMLRSEDLPSQVGFAMTICGAVGNIVDRVRFGYVRDFIYWHGGFQWPNFNVADMLVCVGVGVLVVLGGRKKKEEPAKDGAKVEPPAKAAEEK
ncbi:MAG: signal peptidase II [Myxococcales bacterium]